MWPAVILRVRKVYFHLGMPHCHLIRGRDFDYPSQREGRARPAGSCSEQQWATPFNKHVASVHHSKTVPQETCSPTKQRSGSKRPSRFLMLSACALHCRYCIHTVVFVSTVCSSGAWLGGSSADLLPPSAVAESSSPNSQQPSGWQNQGAGRMFPSMLRLR